MMAAHKAVKEMFDIFMREGTTEVLADRLTTFDDLKRFIGLPEARWKRRGGLRWMGKGRAACNPLALDFAIKGCVTCISTPDTRKSIAAW